MGHYLLSSAPKTGTGDLLISVQAVEPLCIPIINQSVLRTFEHYMNNVAKHENDINALVYNLYDLSLQEKEFIDSQYT